MTSKTRPGKLVAEGTLSPDGGNADARFPVRPPDRILPSNYADLLADVKRRVQEARVRAVLSANAQLVLLYWDIGHRILGEQGQSGWGAKVIDRLAQDLRNSFPDMKGLSERNLKYMRAFAVAWPDRSFVQQLAAQIPWTHNCMLLDKVSDDETRRWYIQQTIRNGWSRNVLAVQIDTRLHERQGNAVSNFKSTLPPADSELVAQAFKDPYLFDFLGTADVRAERDIEQSLIDHIQHFLLELGAGFAFVGRQVHLEVGDQDFYIDLLFYHLQLRCFVVVELKAVPFDPAFVGQLNLYLSAVDDLLRHSDDKPTVGLLLCRDKNQVVVEYALRGLKKPIGVAKWQARLVKSLPNDLKGSLPSIEELEKELSTTKGQKR